MSLSATSKSFLNTSRVVIQPPPWEAWGCQNRIFADLQEHPHHRLHYLGISALSTVRQIEPQKEHPVLLASLRIIPSPLRELQKMLLYKTKTNADKKHVSLQSHCLSDNYLAEYA